MTEGTGRGFTLQTPPRAYHCGEFCRDASSTAGNGGSSGISSSCGSAEGPAGSSCETSPDMYWLGMKGLGEAKNGVDPALKGTQKPQGSGGHCLVWGGIVWGSSSWEHRRGKLWELWSAGEGHSRSASSGLGEEKGVKGRVPPFHLCARSYPGGLKEGSWQWDSEGGESICDGLWGTGALREGGTPPNLLGGGGESTLLPTLPRSYLWKGELSLSGTIIMLLSTLG